MITQWTDAYRLAVADQIARDFGPHRPDLLDRHPTLPFDRLDALIEQATQLGATIDRGEPELTTCPASAAEPARALEPVIAEIRAAGAEFFSPIDARDNHIVCTTEFPLVHTRIPASGAFEPRHVHLLNLGDVPATHQAWTTRARIAECSSLRVLYLYGDQLDEGHFDIAVDALPALEVLDLGDNRFRRVPEAVLRCSTLKTLKLPLNPLDEASGLERLGGLVCLELTGTNVSARDVAHLRKVLPNCRILSSAGE